MTGRVIALVAAACVSTVSAGQGPPAAEPRIPNPSIVEVASVVRNVARTGPRGVNIRPGGTVVITNSPMRVVVEMAHRIQPTQLAGGPDWLDTDFYDITAKSTTGTMDLGIMTDVLLAVLADRFKLKTHIEQREVPVYALVAADPGKLAGPGLKPVAGGCGSAAKDGVQWRCNVATPPGRVAGAGIDMEIFASLLAGPLGRVVVNRTGVNGWFDINVEYVPDTTVPGAPAGVPLVTALREQLGLRVEAARAPVAVTVIDTIERPTEN